MSLTDGVDKQPLYDPDSLNGKQRRGADHTFKIQAAREAKKASKGNATSTNSSEILPDHGCLSRLATVAREETLLHATRAAATFAATPDATILQKVAAISPAIGNQPQTFEAIAPVASSCGELLWRASFEAIDLDSDVVEHMQAQHPLNTPTSMGDAGSDETKQVGSLMESEDCATLAYISAAVDSLCGVARKHGHMVVSFESRGYKVVLGKSNAD